VLLYNNEENKTKGRYLGVVLRQNRERKRSTYICMYMPANTGTWNTTKMPVVVLKAYLTKILLSLSF
jgi:hypothetical protein